MVLNYAETFLHTAITRAVTPQSETELALEAWSCLKCCPLPVWQTFAGVEM
jgi:hypothetical protein